MKKEQADKIYSAFLVDQRVVAPENLQEDILRAIRTRDSRKLRIATVISVAAAILITAIMLTVIKPWQSNEMEYIDKVALLLEARSILSENTADNNTETDIIYEDEEILIYYK